MAPASRPSEYAPGSLAFRLVLSAMGITLVVLLVVGFVLSSLYRTAAERAFDRRLDVYLKTIVAEVANASDEVLPEPVALGDPLFAFPNSGWYWQITLISGTGEARRRASRSLVTGALPLLAVQGIKGRPGLMREGYVKGPHGEELRLAERDVDLGSDARYVVSVAAVASELEEEISAFNLALAGTLVVLACAFLLVVMVQVRFGLKPLTRISQALADVRSGKAERLEGAYPDEITPLVREVNALIDANKEIVERARTHVGNLAHALKTPLSVLMNEAGTRDDPLAVRVRDQAGVMRDQVAHHLERARMAARVSVVASVCEVTPVITALARTMEKIHRGKDLAIEVHIRDDVHFRGEQQDLEEMIGNLVDNACKWASSRVGLEVCIGQPGAPGDRVFFHVIIDDDGPGLDPARRVDVGRRGRRLDESKPGSGLGLSIVHELALLYGGRFELSSAPVGGLRTELVLPAAAPPLPPSAP
ncbi:HAMP domain-containing histidine kinase [Xanthobacter autotrophicus]|uniref:sensor histidine kinase n=1 Tax=Xanthobacter TaxID=279 RepID=UPI0024AAB085|nr:HAMP domain-containing sensor histidine kinase [Xanthobacter autotrophicus]MDI4665253.1 HAMP domain-containing histidine kinase [Xanthobacter autotrophicus]